MNTKKEKKNEKKGAKTNLSQSAAAPSHCGD